VLIVFLITVAFLANSEYKKYLAKKNMDPAEFRSMLRLKIDEVGKELLAKLAVSVLVSVVISLVSFRELWMNDCFHIVFLTNLLSKPTYKRLKKILE
jgi:hypothetical protein